MAVEFAQLSTVKFQEKMKPAALKVYQRLFPGCRIEDLRAEGVKVHVLDKEFGIDSLLIMRSQQWLSVQEKYRRVSAWKYREFTQEYMNAAGTAHESPGEWFKLGAQVYFYGWADEEEESFSKWILLDIARYKALVETLGGLDVIGTLQRNQRHGRSTFYAIPIAKLSRAMLATNIPDIGGRYVAFP